MYSIIDTPNFRILTVQLPTTKKFTSGGELIELDKTGMAFIPLGKIVSVCKVLHFQMSSVRMTKSIQALHHNSNIAKFNLSCDDLVAREKEILLSSLDQLENI